MTRNQKHAFRKKARRHLPALVAAQGGVCRYCRNPIVAVATLDPEAIIHRDETWVEWREGETGLTRRVMAATVDHVRFIRSGGSNDPSNLVAACLYCNGCRNRTPSPKPLAERCVCPKCGGPKPPRRRKCDGCRRGEPPLI
jgi:hypothetical protein